MDTTETPVTKAANATPSWRIPGEKHAFAILKTFLTQEKTVLAQIDMYCLLLHKNNEDHEMHMISS